MVNLDYLVKRSSWMTFRASNKNCSGTSLVQIISHVFDQYFIRLVYHNINVPPNLGTLDRVTWYMLLVGGDR